MSSSLPCIRHSLIVTIRVTLSNPNIEIAHIRKIKSNSNFQMKTMPKTIPSNYSVDFGVSFFARTNTQHTDRKIHINPSKTNNIFTDQTPVLTSRMPLMSTRAAAWYWHKVAIPTTYFSIPKHLTKFFNIQHNTSACVCFNDWRWYGIKNRRLEATARNKAWARPLPRHDPKNVKIQ